LGQAWQRAAKWHELLARETRPRQQLFKLSSRILMMRVVQEPAPVFSQETANVMAGKLHSTHY
jgi:hypothetical protein